MEWMVSFMPRPHWLRKKESPVSMHRIGDCVVPTPVRTLSRNYKTLYLPGIELRFLDSRTRNLSCNLSLSLSVSIMTFSSSGLGPLCFHKDIWPLKPPPAPRFVTQCHFWRVWVSSVLQTACSACPMSECTGLPISDFWSNFQCCN